MSFLLVINGLSNLPTSFKVIIFSLWTYYYFISKAVNEQMPSFKGHLQQDVQEFFCQLLSKLNNEKTHPDPNCSEEILNCVVNRMFTGAWQSEVTCIGCGNSNQNKEQFNTLPLEFPNKYHKIQVYQLILF